MPEITASDLQILQEAIIMIGRAMDRLAAGQTIILDRLDDLQSDQTQYHIDSLEHNGCSWKAHVCPLPPTDGGGWG